MAVTAVDSQAANVMLVAERDRLHSGHAAANNSPDTSTTDKIIVIREIEFVLRWKIWGIPKPILSGAGREFDLLHPPVPFSYVRNHSCV